MTLLIQKFPGRGKEKKRGRVIFLEFFCFSIFTFKYDNSQARLCYSDVGDDDGWTNQTARVVEWLLLRMDEELSGLRQKKIIQCQVIRGKPSFTAHTNPEFNILISTLSWRPVSRSNQNKEEWKIFVTTLKSFHWSLVAH